MILAIHANALHSILTSADDDSTAKRLSHSRIVATEWILDHFESKFSTATERDLLQAFLANMGATGGIKLVDDLPESDEIAAYEIASHYGGKNLIVVEASALAKKDLNHLTSRGTRVRDLSSIEYDGALAGITPFESHRLPHLKGQSPQSVVGVFFGGAKSALFYDKYINESSCSFISLALSNMTDDATIDIVTTAQAMSSTEIRRIVRLRGTQKMQIEIADSTTEKFFHERYCYIDTGYEIYAPRGLDCFGRSPKWLNLNTTISVYDNHDGKSIPLVCRPHAGRAKTRTISIKSKLVA